MTWDMHIIEQSSDSDLAQYVVNGLNRLLDVDRHLLEADVNERTITHRLGMYLQDQFQEWDVDCEYNRNRHDPKYLGPNLKQVDNDDTQGNTVYPDIIVHKRGEENNYLVIEVKKSSSYVNDNEDLDKLERFQQYLGYEYALFLRIGVGNQNTGKIAHQWVIA